MKRLTYIAEGGTSYPVSHGDVWRVGDHFIGCLDVTKDPVEPFISEFGPASLAYCDLPYNQAMVTQYYGKAGLTGIAPRWEQVVDAVLIACRASGARTLIELGTAGADAAQAQASRLGGTVTASWQITYYGKKPAFLMDVRWDESEYPEVDLSGMDDSKTPQAVIEAHLKEGPVTILDACIGQGLTAVSAHRAGAKCIGFDLHPNRVSVTLSKLSGLGAGVPQRVQERPTT